LNKPTPIKKFFYWAPRVLSILFIVFVSMFALDVLGYPQWYIALFFHLIPSYILIILTIFAWKYERIGGFLFFIAGILMFAFLHWIIAIPAFLIALLYLVKVYWLKP